MANLQVKDGLIRRFGYNLAKRALNFCVDNYEDYSGYKNIDVKWSYFDKLRDEFFNPDRIINIDYSCVPELNLIDRVLYIWDICNPMSIGFYSSICIDDWGSSLKYISYDRINKLDARIFEAKYFGTFYSRYLHELNRAHESCNIGGFGLAWNNGSIKKVTQTLNGLFVAAYYFEKQKGKSKTTNNKSTTNMAIKTDKTI